MKIESYNVKVEVIILIIFKVGENDRCNYSRGNRKIKYIGVSGRLYTEHPRLLSNTCHTPPALPQHSNSHPQQNNFCMTSSCAARRRTSGIV